MTYGVPAYNRSDNGSEFIAVKVQACLKENQIKTIYIDPASSWQKATSKASTAAFAMSV